MKITHFDANYPWNLGNTLLSQGGGVAADTGNSGSGGGGGGGAPSGPASGDLGGSYPGPTVVAIHGVAVDTPPGTTTTFLNGAGHFTTPAPAAGTVWRPLMVADLDGTHWNVVVDGYGNAIMTS